VNGGHSPAVEADLVALLRHHGAALWPGAFAGGRGLTELETARRAVDELVAHVAEVYDVDGSGHEALQELDAHRFGITRCTETPPARAAHLPFSACRACKRQRLRSFVWRRGAAR
jgi:hypothetical protein